MTVCVQYVINSAEINQTTLGRYSAKIIFERQNVSWNRRANVWS